MKEYPSEHKEIVTSLLDGKFIIYPSPLFTTIQKSDEAYKAFFKESFAYDLVIEAEYAYLSASDLSEKRTRDFTLFLAVLCRELDYSGKNFKDAVELSSFDIVETEELLKSSPKWEILEKTSVANFESFIETWRKRNLIVRTGNAFKFTKAIHLFFAFAVNIANAKLKEE